MSITRKNVEALPEQEWLAMSKDDPPPDSSSSKDVSRPVRAQKRSFFEIPPALRRIFDRYPLVTYAENELPLRGPSRTRDEHVLYIFAAPEDAQKGRPSYNPGCLKWQVQHKRRLSSIYMR